MTSLGKSLKTHLDRDKLVRGDEVGLVEQNDVGKCDLLLRLRRPIDLLRQVLAANVLVDK